MARAYSTGERKRTNYAGGDLKETKDSEYVCSEVLDLASQAHGRGSHH